MKLMKKVKLIETKVTYSSKKIDDDNYSEHGIYIIECPSCGKCTHISYHYRGVINSKKDDRMNMDEKYCPYCGSKLVEED